MRTIVQKQSRRRIRHPKRRPSFFSECGTLLNRGVLSKSHNHQAWPARRLAIEAVYPLLHLPGEHASLP